ncbi:MAG: hypothetical protein ACYC1K_01410 [Minisyncoccota bacterium]
MGYEDIRSDIENPELSPEEEVPFNDILQVFISRIVGRQHSELKGAQDVLDKWVEENAHKYVEAFNALKNEMPDFLDRCIHDQDTMIDMIEKRMKSLS